MFGYVGISIVNFTIHLAYGVILMLYSRRIIGKLTIYLKHIALIFLSGVILWVLLILLKLFNLDIMIRVFFKNTILILSLNLILCFFPYYLITSAFKVNYVSKLKNKYFLGMKG